LPLKEQALAIDILKSLPGIGDLLGDLQARNGYDFDNKAGNQLRGHAGFPSIPDDSTGYERSSADSVAMLQSLDALQNQVQMVHYRQSIADAQTPGAIKLLTGALDDCMVKKVAKVEARNQAQAELNKLLAEWRATDESREQIKKDIAYLQKKRAHTGNGRRSAPPCARALQTS
jgi:hypothetical protein